MTPAPAPDDIENARLARQLMRSANVATLATADSEREGWPYGSLVQCACGIDAAPLLLLSDLAVHSRNIADDGRVSLLYAAPGDSDSALTRARVTVFGRAVRTNDQRELGRFVARHPDARDYLGFADFNLYRVEPVSGHLVAGFGRIVDIDGDALTLGAPALAAAADDVVAHMNADHGDAVGLYATVLLGRSGAGWQMTAIDPEGCDLRRPAADGDGPDVHLARLDFEEPVADADAARVALVRHVRQARAGASR